MYRKNSKHISVFILFLFIGFLVSIQTGCKKEAEKPVEKAEVQKDSTPVKVDTPKVVEKPKVEYPDLLGKWTGTFDKRATTLVITEQDTTEFKGKITIAYREVINQEVSGTLDMAKKQVKMKDLLHSRYAGTYTAKLSEEMNSMSGTFIMTVDKMKMSFNLKKK